jgi:ABC-2 type transport system permease protein
VHAAGGLVRRAAFRGSVLALFAISSAALVPALGRPADLGVTKNQVASQVALLSAFCPR